MINLVAGVTAASTVTTISITVVWQVHEIDCVQVPVGIVGKLA